MSWQPIETAPKDGTKLLLHVLGNHGGNSIHVARWDAAYIGSGWGHRWIHTDHWDGVSGKPTHWMPLPEPPTNAEKEQEVE